MIGDKNMVMNATRMAWLGGMYAEVVSLVYDLRWLVLLSFILVFADLWFGIGESRKTGREIRRSKAQRRTANKIVDYLVVATMGGVLGKAIGEPLGIDYVKVAAVVMLLTCTWELDSIYGHICVLKGAKKDFSVRRFLIGLFKSRNEAVKDALEEAKVEN